MLQNNLMQSIFLLLCFRKCIMKEKGLVNIMKKILFLTLLVLLTSVSYVSARTQYDSTGRHIIYDDSLRAHKRAEEQKQAPKQIGAAAAKINFDADLDDFDAGEQKLKSNFYQDTDEFKAKHYVMKKPASNYYQSSAEYKAKHNIK